MYIFRQLKHRIHFSRWSRKNYSLFSCLGKEVSIRTLKYELTDVGMMARESCFRLFLSKEVFQKKGIKEELEEIEYFPIAAFTGLVCPEVSMSGDIAGAVNTDFIKKR